MMKKTKLFIILILLISCNNEKTAKSNLEQSNSPEIEISSVKESKNENLVLKLPWDSNCCSTMKYREGNLGVAGFAIVDSNKIAILCEVDSLIRIYEMNSNKLLKEIKLARSFGEIGYSDWTKCFYLSYRNKLYEYSYENDSSTIIDINNEIDGIVEFISLDSNIYCVTASNENYLLINNGNPVLIEEQLNNKIEGVVINSDTYVRFNKRRRSVEVTEYFIDTSHRYFVNIKEESSVYKLIASCDNQFIFLRYLNVNKEGKTYAVNFLSLSKEEKRISNFTELPNIYYTSILNNIKTRHGKIYNLISSPNAVMVFEIDMDKISTFNYPDSLNYDFHFNRDL